MTVQASATRRRTRRTPEESRRLILEAAEALLAEGGPSAVQVRAVAAKVGVTDAAVNHHFGTRADLIEALLRHGGRRVRARVERATAAWEAGSPASVAQLVDALAEVYADGYGELALALHTAGWRDRGSGMLAAAVDALHGLRVEQCRAMNLPPPDRKDTQLAVAALHQGIALDAVFGRAFRRSAGMSAKEAENARAARDWWAEALSRILGLDT